MPRRVAWLFIFKLQRNWTMPRIFAALMLAIAVAVLANSAAAQDKTHEGIVASVAENKLVMTDKEGKGEHTHMIDAATHVTLDGKAAKITDLKKGDAVKVTTNNAGKVSAVAATRGAAK